VITSSEKNCAGSNAVKRNYFIEVCYTWDKYTSNCKICF